MDSDAALSFSLPPPMSLRALAMEPLLNRMRHQLNLLVEKGIITLHPDVILRVGQNGLLEAERLQNGDAKVEVKDQSFDITEIPATDPPLYLAGANVQTCFRDKWGHGLRCEHHGVRAIMFGEERDSPFFEPMLKPLSNLPKMCHIDWKRAAEYIQKLPQGNRFHGDVVRRLCKAQLFDACDRHTVCEMTYEIETIETVSHERFNITLPMSIGHLMGLLRPEAQVEGNLWENYFRVKAYEVDAEVADAVTVLFRLLRVMREHPELKETLKPLALAKQDLIKERFEAIQMVGEIKDLHDFIRNAEESGWCSLSRPF